MVKYFGEDKRKYCKDPIAVDNSALVGLLEAILAELQNSDNVEGLYTTPVCFDDGTSGFVAIVFSEDTGVYTPQYFDSQYQPVTGKTVVPCIETNVQIGPPLDFCN